MKRRSLFLNSLFASWLKRFGTTWMPYVGIQITVQQRDVIYKKKTEWHLKTAYAVKWAHRKSRLPFWLQCANHWWSKRKMFPIAAVISDSMVAEGSSYIHIQELWSRRTLVEGSRVCWLVKLSQFSLRELNNFACQKYTRWWKVPITACREGITHLAYLKNERRSVITVYFGVF